MADPSRDETVAAEIASTVGVPALTPPPQLLFGGRFSIEIATGKGGMGTVYRARDRETGAAVALKLMDAEAASPIRFAREAEMLAELSHPSIVRHIAHGSTADCVFLVMEWLEGVSLSQRLEGGGLGIDETVVLGMRVAEGLDAAHRRGIIHRDIKPSNLVLEGGRVEEVRIVDFGVARSLAGGAQRMTMTGALVGTPGYMAPEQARGAADVGCAADVFALGCVLYHCLTGQPPFFGDDPFAVLMMTVLQEPARPSTFRDVPRQLEDLVMAMLSKAADDRPPDMLAVRAALAEVAARGVEAGAPPSRHLTSSEQRLSSVVLARRGVMAPAAPDAELHDTLHRHGGRLETLVDGSILVALPESTSPTDQAIRAARCSLALRTALPDAAIAVATGRGWLDECGAPVIQRVARLLSSTGAISIDDVTAGLLDTRFDLAVGRDGFELRAERAVGDEGRTLLGRPSPCVGRDRELDLLDGLFEECLGEPVARKVVVTGEAGIGKSRVRRELLRRLGERHPGIEVWLGGGDPMGAGSPFGVLAPALLRSAGVSLGQPVVLRRQRWQARVARNLGRSSARWATARADEIERVTVFLGELVGVAFPDEGNDPLRAARQDPRLMADQIRRAWQDFVGAECAAQPVVIVIEDLHWGDRPSLDLVGSAFRSLEAAPLFVAAFGRPEARELFPQLWGEHGAEQHVLRPLARRASEELVQRILGETPTREQVEHIVGLAQGNAFYLEELIRAVAEGRAESAPETILAMVEGRLARLDATARRVLRAASVFGGVFWTGAVRSLLGRRPTGEEVNRELVALAEAEIITREKEQKHPGEEQYRFRHALVRQAAYETLTADDRREGHARAGRWLEAQGVGESLVLAEHFERGGEPSRAIGWYQKAVDQALEGNDLVGAIERIERAIGCGCEGEALGALLQRKAYAHRWQGDKAGAEQCAAQAILLLSRGTEAWCAAACELGVQGGTSKTAADLAAVARELLELDADPSVVVSNARTAAGARLFGPLLRAGHTELGRGVLAASEALLQRLDSPEPTTLARMHRAYAYRALAEGDTVGYLRNAEATVGRFEQAGQLREACSARVDVGFALIELGDYVAAEGNLRRALAIAEQMTLPHTVAYAESNLAWALAMLGQLDEARRCATSSAEASAAQGRRANEGSSRYYLAAILARQGDSEGAEREARSAVALLDAAPGLRAFAMATLAHVLLLRAEGREALEHARAARELLAGLGGLEEGEALVRLVLVEALEDSGDHATACAELRDAAARVRERSAMITEPQLRASFERVPANARTLELARAWLGDDAANLGGHAES